MVDYYLDTCIWLDLCYQREPYYLQVRRSIDIIISNQSNIFYSDIIKNEFKQLGLFDSEIDFMFQMIPKILLKRVHIYDQQIEEAHKLAKIRNVPKKDALHAILARDNNAVLLTKDHDFERLKDIATVYLIS